MSLNASQLVLNQLVFRHLKECGLHSVAEELQRHSPQGDTNISVSLLDIYQSWLKDPKRKKKPNSAKSSSSGEKAKTPTKAKSITQRKKTDKPGKRPASTKKSVPQKRKKGEEENAESVKAKKSKLQPAGEAAGGDDSDSDSSLDVEKWKKRVLQMTEEDIVKMESISVLDSSTPLPKKRRVRKPRAKPTDAPVQQNNEKSEQKTATQARKRTPKKSLPKNTEHVTSSGTPSQERELCRIEDKPAASPEKQTHVHERTVPVTVREETNKTEPEKKKKKAKKEKEASQNNMEGNAKAKHEERKTTENLGQEAADKPETEKIKDAKLEAEKDPIEKNKNHMEDISESAVQVTQTKKKKKEKTRCEESPADVVKEKKVKKKKVFNGDENSDLNSPEDIVENTDQITANKDDSEKSSEQHVKEKKVKKKKKEAGVSEADLQQETVEGPNNTELVVDEEENSEQTSKKKKAKKKKKSEMEENTVEEVQKKKVKKKKEKNPDGDISEQILEEETNKMSKQTSKDNESNDPNETLKDAGDVAEATKSQGSADLLSPADLETSPPRKKKKKKHKSDELPDVVSAPDVAETQTTCDSYHKKKTKSKNS